ncbi:MAG: stage II sporulation protein M [Gracilibacteraceae bacterium]|nr:stage II sporulation protein M [Gracilibacteraceae bacterium]
MRAVCVVFVLFFGGGLIAAAVYPDTALEIIVALGQSFADKGLFTAAPLAQVWLIFLNNLTVCVLLLVLGLVPFLFLPYVVVALNALTAGVVVQALPLPDGSGRFWAAAVSLLPHGVFELPALFIAAALGAFCCARLTGVILHRTRLPAADAPPTRPIRTALLLAKTFLLLVLPLLVVAAATEVWLTPLAQKALL